VDISGKYIDVVYVLSVSLLAHCFSVFIVPYFIWIIIGSDRRPETKQGIEGKIVRFRSGRVRDRDKDRRSEAMIFGTC